MCLFVLGLVVLQLCKAQKPESVLTRSLLAVRSCLNYPHQVKLVRVCSDDVMQMREIMKRPASFLFGHETLGCTRPSVQKDEEDFKLVVLLVIISK